MSILKYFKLRYLIFIIKLISYKIRFRRELITSGFWYGFEKDFFLRLESGGVLELGRMVYFSKRTDIIAIGGKIKIGDNVFINKDCTIVSRQSISIGSNCCLGEGVSIYDHDHKLEDFNAPIASQGFVSSPVSLGDNVWVGGKAFIKSGVHIGSNVIIGANSVVTKNIPDGVIAYGNPAHYKPNSAASRATTTG
jgi:acetyltransferase-like isoleucine patch superfamily enzyme